jgi:cell division protein FtsZ
MTINIQMPETIILKPCITVFGVGGAGCNAVNNMITASLEGANFVVANTDAQALEHSLASKRIQLGETLTRGLGAGASPAIGAAAAEEASEEIIEIMRGSNMVFITAGMGGGTGTGAAPVLARIAQEQGILTVGVVTKPFHFEGAHRMKMAEQGLAELQKYVDTLIVIPNQNLFRIANERTTFADAFKMADDVLHSGVRSITDLITMPGLINLDFADIVTIMSKMGKAMMGTGEAAGDSRAIQAAEAAISNPLLDNSSMKGAKGVLINITGGLDMTLFEVDEAANRIREEVDGEANIIFGSAFNKNLEGKIRVSVVATGIDQIKEIAAPKVHQVKMPNANLNSENIAMQVEEKPKLQETIIENKNEDIVNEELADESNIEQDVVVKPVSNIDEDSSVNQMEKPENNFVNIRPSNLDNFINNMQANRFEEEKPAAKFSGFGGLFTKVANSVFSVSNNAPDEDDSEISVVDEEQSHNSKDDINIPAFLRRKS